jgi:predicted enzyme related to lactoylglutathione lyase
MAVPGIGWTAYFTDPEGNAFGIMQFDPSAA